VAPLNARGSELRQLRLARDNRGMGTRQSPNRRAGCRGIGAIRCYEGYDPYAILFHCTSVYVRRIEWRASEPKSKLNRKNSTSAGRSRHPSALAPHSASPGPHRLIYIVGMQNGGKVETAKVDPHVGRTGSILGSAELGGKATGALPVQYCSKNNRFMNGQ
jgi:hypothetical protein